MDNKKNPIKLFGGLAIMRKTTKEMVEYQERFKDKIDPAVRARNFRFLGSQADVLHQYAQSEKFYRQGLSFFEPLERIDQRYQSLEFNGFLSYSLLRQHKNGWFELMEKTLLDFDKSMDGEWLKSNDYYTWAVWKSGIEIRNSDALLDTRKSKNQYREHIDNWLNDADLILRMPDGKNDGFVRRRRELAEVVEKFQS